MTIYAGTYAVYERLASTKMNSMVAAINSHTHNGTYGIKINFSNLAGTISASQIPNDIITSDSLADNSVTTSHILNGTILIGDLNLSSIHLDSNGYAVYA